MTVRKKPPTADNAPHHVMRIAEAGQVIIRGDSDRATGELIDTETVTISSEEGRWKRAERYLAGGLSYRQHGSKGGLGKRTER